mgnify:CR=1 FL=1
MNLKVQEIDTHMLNTRTKEDEYNYGVQFLSFGHHNH